MSRIDRAPDRSNEADFDLIVIGGGIHGVALALEAACRGLRPLLLERGDFGGATSANSLKVLHGGFRYLQTADLARFFASVAERRWFALHFPELVRPLPCLMPLYGTGIRRPSLFRVGLVLNDLLSAARNRGVDPRLHLPGGRVLSPAETAAEFPEVRREGLRGAGMWHDAVMSSSERVLIEMLRWACACGATALNYVEARRLLHRSGRTAGVEALDRESGAVLRFHAPVVVNCAGAWSEQVAEALDNAAPGIFHAAMAFNLLLEHPPVARTAVAVSPPGGGHTYFLLPWKGRILAGTYHAPWNGGAERVHPTEDQIDRMLTDLTRCIPGLRLRRDHVLRVFAGLVPSDRPGSAEPSGRDRILDHSRLGGITGFFSSVGVKFTTARSLAERTLRVIYGRTPPASGARPPLPAGDPSFPVDDERAWSPMIDEEAVLHLDDLLLRRMEWEPGSRAAQAIAPVLAARRHWGEDRYARELARLNHSVPGALAAADVDGSTIR